jgi:SAM-dependent methyltransferase
MAQNIYDTPDFFAGYSRLRRSVQGLAGAPEWPAIRAMLPPLAGKRIVDLGCGFGWFARWARSEGAAHVLGLDLSENMLARARAETADAAIDYAIADLDTLTLPEAAFDLAYSSLAFHYVADFARLIGMIHRALRPGGALVFTIEHPMRMAPRRPDFVTDAEGHRSWPVDGYPQEGERVTDWLAKGVVKYHRMLGTTLNTLIAAGFVLRQVEEWHPSPEQVAQGLAAPEERACPFFLLVAAGRAAAAPPG